MYNSISYGTVRGILITHHNTQKTKFKSPNWRSSENLIFDATEAPCPSGVHLDTVPTHRTLTNAQGDMPSSPMKMRRRRPRPRLRRGVASARGHASKQLKAAGHPETALVFGRHQGESAGSHTKANGWRERAQSDFDKWEKFCRIRPY